MERNKIFVLLHFLFFIQIASAQLMYNLGDVNFGGRYADPIGQKFYSSDFNINIHLHENLFTVDGVNQLLLDEVIGVWNNAGSFINLNVVGYTNTYPILFGEAYPGFNVIGFDNINSPSKYSIPFNSRDK